MKNNKRRSTSRRRSPSNEFDQRSEIRRLKRAQRRKKARIRNFLLVVLILLIAIITSHNIITSPEKNVARLGEAIKTNDQAFLKEKTDKLDTILKTLKESYSKDEKKQEEFINAFFKNLDISYVDSKKEGNLIRVDLKVRSVNYVKVYDDLKNKNHDAYIKALADENSKKVETETSIYLKNRLFSSKILETRDFVNALLGRALDEIRRKI